MMSKLAEMPKLAKIVAYFCQNFPLRNKLSNARLTKMIYLADLISVKNNNDQLTNIQWYFDHYGPFVPDIEKVAAKYSDFFLITESMTIYGTPKKEISLIDNNIKIDLNLKEQEILDQVINDTKNLNWSDFIRYVYDTDPIKNSHKYSHLDLKSKQ